MKIFRAYQDFALECKLMNYSNRLKDKFEFLKMYFSGDYDWLFPPK